MKKIFALDDDRHRPQSIAMEIEPEGLHELFKPISDCRVRSGRFLTANRYGKTATESYCWDDIIGESEPMKTLKLQVRQVAETDATVYIQGESGTGKELIARSLHRASSRREGPFVAVNCAALPETLLESELFGYVKGAFTGAEKHKQGLFAKAHGGTFLLDEISELPLIMQAKLLRVLEDKKVCPLGSTAKPVTIDARILAASNKNLAEAVQRGNFREDLFYRIHVISIEIPPLRERREDIPLLANHFLNKYSRELDKPVKGFTHDALEKLMCHRWPGNVRELGNEVAAAVVMADQDFIAEDMILSNPRSAKIKPKSFKAARADFERHYLMQLLKYTRGNVTRAAGIAEKHRADLYELLKKHRLNPADFRKKTDQDQVLS